MTGPRVPLGPPVPPGPPGPSISSGEQRQPGGRRFSLGFNPTTKSVILIIDESVTRVTEILTLDEAKGLVNILQELIVKLESGIVMPQGPIAGAN